MIPVLAGIGALVGGANAYLENKTANENMSLANRKAKIDALNYAWTGQMPNHVPQEINEWGNLLGGVTGGAMTGVSFGAANPDLFGSGSVTPESNEAYRKLTNQASAADEAAAGMSMYRNQPFSLTGQPVVQQSSYSLTGQPDVQQSSYSDPIAERYKDNPNAWVTMDNDEYIKRYVQQMMGSNFHG